MRLVIVSDLAFLMGLISLTGLAFIWQRHPIASIRSEQWTKQEKTGVFLPKTPVFVKRILSLTVEELAVFGKDTGSISTKELAMIG